MRNITVAEYQEAITLSHGILAAAARRLGVSRVSVHKAVNKHPTLKAALEEARDEVLDLAESRLFEAVNAGTLSAIIFMLSTLGKNRGYVPRQEVHTPMLTQRELEALSDEELEEHVRRLGV